MGGVNEKVFMVLEGENKTAMAKNEFHFEPIREVGWLFLGIFATMQPALQLISNFAAGHADSLGVSTFYWATGVLSGILDNAPTYQRKPLTTEPCGDALALCLP